MHALSLSPTLCPNKTGTFINQNTICKHKGFNNLLDKTSGSLSSNEGTADIQTIGVLQTANVSKTSPTAAVSKTLTYKQKVYTTKLLYYV